VDPSSLTHIEVVDTSWLEVGVAVLLVLLNGFFVAAEFALVKLRLAQAEELAAEGGVLAGTLLHVRSHLDAYLSACQLGITLASLALGWIGEETFAELVRPALGAFGIENPKVVSAVAIGAAFFIITFLHIVIGEQAPKSLAIRRPERVALWSAAPLRLFYWAAYPVIWFLNQSSLLVLRLLKVDLKAEGDDAYSADEIRQVLASSHLHGELGAVEKDILARTLDLRELSVGDLMRPASEMVVLDLTAGWAENLARIEVQGYSRYPAVEGDRDAVVGVILVKDLWAAQRKGASLEDLRPLVREIPMVHRDTKAFELLRMFREGQPHFAVVDDDLGTTLGFVTMDHLIAAMVGDVQDEYRRARAAWQQQPDGSYLGDGKLSLYSLEQVLGRSIEVEEVDSVGGLVMWKLERVPEKGARVALPGFEVVVREMRGPRIAQVQVIPKKG
jgi:CBS domain containing-hemolysin-like protein